MKEVLGEQSCAAQLREFGILSRPSLTGKVRDLGEDTATVAAVRESYRQLQKRAEHIDGQVVSACGRLGCMAKVSVDGRQGDIGECVLVLLHQAHDNATQEILGVPDQTYRDDDACAQ